VTQSIVICEERLTARYRQLTLVHCHLWARIRH